MDRAAYRIIEIKGKGLYVGEFVDDYLSKDNENLDVPVIVNFKFKNIFNYIFENKITPTKYISKCKQTKDCTTWSGQCLDPITRTLLQKGDTVRIQQYLVDDANERNWYTSFYYVILHIDNDIIKCEIEDPYMKYNDYHVDHYSILRTTIHSVSEIPTNWMDKERSQLFEKYLLNTGYSITGVTVS